MILKNENGITDGNSVVTAHTDDKASAQWVNVTDVCVNVVSVSGQAPLLYANGLNMIAVRVYMTSQDINEKTIDDIDVNELVGAVTLIDYDTGVPFTKIDHPPSLNHITPGGTYCTVANKYLSGSNFINPGISGYGKRYITLYFAYNGTSSTSVRIGCKIKPTYPDKGADGRYVYNEVVNSINGDTHCPTTPIKVTVKKFKDSDVTESHLYSANVSTGKSPNRDIFRYYIKFSDGVITHVDLPTSSQPGAPTGYFHYKQTGNYKDFCCFTDDKFDVDPSAKWTTPTFKIDNSWSDSVTFYNHEEDGVCIFLYRFWYGALWSYQEWNLGAIFTLYDEYGNACKISAIRDEPNDKIKFSVVN
ncbi:putative surface protein [Xenorhabdus nematophila ATCC 19061]|uniref:Surface protein n=1 Tax=Xenorhabdus nematophila (strain ATCC 19061 / DSM 3370 / CCUG 14189 / LMG 1036 / NCIMB 9965 / AN6) TaxID=406817 RepID=D3VCX3_XENNA|nr:hypothetical protein [Xenorhabdus nematophila]CBJ89839.1 putative surface protein [Xenorhabdus nematophila ATCC 19061]CEK22723.1 putative surface protein [Xenorhabdus nematophila AN6/1]